MLWIGFDVGGTFTDLIGVNLETKRITATKTPSSATDPAGAAVRGISELLALAEQPADSVTRIVHGTTIATNTLIEGTGAPVGFICDYGFRDVVEIGRMFRENLYDINFKKTPPLVPRDLRKEVSGRVVADGEVLTPLDEDEARAVIDELLEAKVEAIAIGFLHSYANPIHELRLAELVQERAPNMLVSLSHEVSGEYGEHERWTTAIVNAYLMPKMHTYLEALSERIGELGIRAPIEVLQSNGGVVPIGAAAELPVRLLESGPSGGVSGMWHFASQVGLDHLITFDMGGTSTDVCVVIDGKPAIATERIVGGQPIRAVMTDIHSIGAGGGSIARVDRSQTLRVGPESAGAEPGPVALKKGGSRPTITDADLILGYLNPDRYCAGRYPLDVLGARNAIASEVADLTATTVEQAALGIVSIGVENAVGAIRKITTQRGLDPRDFALIVSGGAGAVHAGLVARELHIPTVVVPAYQALLSAQGMLVSDYRTDVSLTYTKLLRDLDPTSLAMVLEELEATARSVLASATGSHSSERIIEVCYEGQHSSFAFPLPLGILTDDDLLALQQGLDDSFRNRYGFVPENNVVKVQNLRVFVRMDSSEGEELRSLVVREEARAEVSATSSRTMVFNEYPDGLDANVYDRAQLGPGVVVEGPATIEEDYSSTVVFPGQQSTVDELGNIILSTGVSTNGA